MKSGWLQRFAVLLGFCFVFVSAHADPENFVVAGFTFVRPAKWKWVWDEKRSKKGNLLEVADGKNTESAPVYFWKFSDDEGTKENRIKAWQQYFHELPDDLNVRLATNRVSSCRIIYVDMEGTNTHPPHQDYGLLGAIIPLKDGNLAIRMSGRSTLIAEAKPLFTKMIEDAAKAQEPE